ncbi:MAG: hypothetical protein HC822_21470 [Oscillochloris sp.]|nr:hypothetical protein [Oscillochloris sp.]
MADVRINEVSTSVNVTDASAMLTPQVLQRIVEAVLAQLAQKQRDDRLAEQDRKIGEDQR